MGANPVTPHAGRIEIIDAYRGIAILGVLAFHYTVRWEEFYGFTATYPAWLAHGALGVPLFFVVSGLVITMTVLRSDDAFHFAFRRAARLYPAFVCAALFTFTVTRLFGPERFQFSAYDLVASLTMDARAFGANYVDGAYWSLAVEVKFYFFVALARLVLRERFWVGVLGISLLSALPLGDTWSYSLIAEWWPYLLLGMSGWFLIFEKRHLEGWVLGCASVCLYLLNRPAGVMADLLVWGLALGLLVMLKVSPAWSPWPIRALAWVGAISYSLYLLHQNVGVTLIGYLTGFGAPDIVAMAVAGAFSIALAYLSYTYVEKPGARMVMTLYGRLRRSQPDRPAEPASA